jgi:tRNA (guanine37-N1)-methyltransferase
MKKQTKFTFHVITLFPELVKACCSASIIGRGISAGHLAVDVYDPREHCSDKYRKVDDSPYGGGPGMVIMPEPIFKAFESIPRKSTSPVLITTPQGTPFNQSLAEEFSTTETEEITIICGHYEGLDERIHTLATHEISIGDYVLTSGELAALVIIDAVGRLIPGVVGKSISLACESFVDHLLEGPQYTKPQIFRGMEVPEILRSGNHEEISRWRRQEALRRTIERRPDLLEQAKLTRDERTVIGE